MIDNFDENVMIIILCYVNNRLVYTTSETSEKCHHLFSRAQKSA